MVQVFHHRGARIVGLVGLPVLTLACAIGMTKPKVLANTGTVITLAIVCSVADFVIWNIGMWPAVRLDDHGIEVRDPLVTRLIPWSQIDSISIRGDAVIHLKDGGRVRPSIFLASVGDAIFGSRKKRSFKAAVDAALTEHPAESGPKARTRLRVAILWPALIAGFLVGESIVLIATR